MQKTPVWKKVQGTGYLLAAAGIIGIIICSLGAIVVTLDKFMKMPMWILILFVLSAIAGASGWAMVNVGQWLHKNCNCR